MCARERVCVLVKKVKRWLFILRTKQIIARVPEVTLTSVC